MSPIIPRFDADEVVLRGSAQAVRAARGRVEAVQIVPTALAGLGHQATRVAANLAEFEVAKNNALNLAEASDKSLVFEREVDEGLQALERAPDARTHTERAAELMRDVRERLLFDSTNADVKARLQLQFNASEEKFSFRARSFANKLVHDQGRASLLEQLDWRERKAVEARDPRDAEAEITAGLEEITRAQRVGLLWPEQAVERQRLFREKVDEGRARREALDNPLETAARLKAGEFESLDGVKRAVLIEQFLSDAKTRQREEDEAGGVLSRRFKEAREFRVSELVSFARDGRLTLPQLEEERRRWRLPREDYERIRDHIEKGPSAGSDPEMLRRLTIGVRSARPTVSKEDLAGLYRQGRLGRDDFEKLDEELTGNLRHAQTEGRTEARSRHQQAEQLLRMSLGADSPFRLWAQEAETALALAFRDLTATSSAFGGQRDPIEIVPEIVGRYLPNVYGAVRARVKVERDQLPAKSIRELGTKAQAMSRGMTEEQYYAVLSKLRELDELERATMARRPTPPPSEGR